MEAHFNPVSPSTLNFKSRKTIPFVSCSTASIKWILPHFTGAFDVPSGISYHRISCLPSSSTYT